MSKNVLTSLYDLADAARAAEDKIAMAKSIDRAVCEAEDRLSRLRADADAAEVSVNEAQAEAKATRLRAQEDAVRIRDAGTVEVARFVTEASAEAKAVVAEAQERAATEQARADLLEAACEALEVERNGLAAEVAAFKEQLLALRSRFVD